MSLWRPDSPTRRTSRGASKSSLRHRPASIGPEGNFLQYNLLAEGSEGFRWRLQSDEGNATSLRPFGEDVIVNMSVWRDLEALRKFVYDSDHTGILKRRREWFAHAPQAYAVLWWVPAGHRPSLAEAAERLEKLRKLGPSPTAFTFGKVFGAP